MPETQGPRWRSNQQPDAPAAGSPAEILHPKRSRLGIYNDDVYHVVDTAAGTRVSADRAFLLFACDVGHRFGKTLLFGRTVRDGEEFDYVLPDGIELVELPHYETLLHARQVLRGTIGTLVGMWRGLGRVDVIWVFGPHPFALPLVVLGVVRRKRVVLGVRIDAVRYFRSRIPNRGWAPGMIVMLAVDGVFRLLARRLPTTVVGTEIARRYSSRSNPALPMTISLVRARDVQAAPPPRDWSGTIDLLTAGRLEPEKNPLLLVRALAELERERPARYHLTWVGRGPLASDVRALAAELDVARRLTLRGYVPFGDELLELYRRAHLFVHVSLTEGLPQVLVEALASGTPIVATDVGGVRAALDGGRCGLLVPSGSVDALVQAVLKLSDDRDLAERMATSGLAFARDLTLETQAERVATFIAGA